MTLSQHKVDIYALVEELEDYADNTKEVLLEPDLIHTIRRAIASVEIPAEQTCLK